MIGILGGTFDPIHNGHLKIADGIFDRLGLSQLQFMPCGEPVHLRAPIASTENRSAMIDLVLADNANYRLNRIEADRDGPSYSIDSLESIRRQSDQRLVLLLGSDAFNGFESWKQPDEILQLAHLVVCLRPGVETVSGRFDRFRVESVDRLEAMAQGAILMLEVGAIACSSTEIRRQASANHFDRQCLHPQVVDYLKRNKLYENCVA